MKNKVLAAGYIRVSHLNQVKEGLSLEAQEEKIRQYCQLKDVELVRLFRDDGKSAKNLKRDGVQELLAEVRKGKIQAVVICKLDRLSRNTTHALELSSFFKKHNVSFHSIEEQIDTESATGEFYFTVLAALAQMERKQAGERIKTVLDHKRTRGEKLGGVRPFGYHVRSGKLIPNPKEQKVISYIKTRRSSGDSYRTIAERLEARGAVSVTGSKNWHPYTVQVILKNHKTRQ